MDISPHQAEKIFTEKIPQHICGDAKTELGLIFVSVRGSHSFAEIVFEPTEFKPTTRDYRKRREILTEINGRTIDTNTGGG